MLSIWEKTSFLKYDYIIIGSGIVGLSTAASIKEKFPEKEILIIERGIFPTGASTKNAGFACFGSPSELLNDINLWGVENTLSLVEQKWKGLLKLRTRLADDKIDYLNYGGYELIDSEQLSILDKISYLNTLLKDIFGKDIFSIKSEFINKFGFNSNLIKALICNPLEGQLDTGKMMKALLNYVSSLGVIIINGCNVEAFNEKSDQVSIEVKHNILNQVINFIAEKIIVCTNAFTKELFPDLDIIPGRGQVLVTKPIKDLKFNGAFHFDKGYYYFRDFYDRIIFGGGRNKDLENETTTKFDFNEKIIEDLLYKLSNIILPNQKYEIDYKWTGIMAFGKEKLPIVRKINNRIIIGVRMSGMGVALASNVGEQISNLIVN